jgi:hypothetical protein
MLDAQLFFQLIPYLMVNTVCFRYKREKLSLPRVHTLQKTHNLVIVVALVTEMIHSLTHSLTPWVLYKVDNDLIGIEAVPL